MGPGLTAKNFDASLIPLKEVEVTGSLIGRFFHGKIMQVYENNITGNAEYLYTFPVSDSAAVCGFNARFGEEEITGAVMEKNEAYEKYEKAVLNGDSAALLERYRPNIFQVSLGQIPPGERVTVKISYIEEFKIIDNKIRITIPTLVAPRYIPSSLKQRKRGASDPDKAPEADFITPPIGEVGYKAKIELDIYPGCTISSIASPSHAVVVNGEPYNGCAKVCLKDGQAAMDRDFIIEISLYEEPAFSGIFAEDKDGDVYSFLSITPELPARPYNEDGRDMVFLIDISGSMDGQKLEDAKTAVNICLRSLSEKDRFSLAAFESSLHKFSDIPTEYNNSSLKNATLWVNGLESLGGTEILPAIEFSMKERPDRERIIMLFTDGQVGNEDEIIEYVKNHNENTRLFALGIDTSVNSYFINDLARAGNGSAEFAYPNENLDDKIMRQFSKLDLPYIENPSVEIEGLQSIDIAEGLPSRISDLDSVSIFAKMNEIPAGKFILKGMVDGERYQQQAELSEDNEKAGALSKLWANLKIRELEAYLAKGNNQRRREETVINRITELSKRYSVMTKYTSFVLVYERRLKQGGLPETIVVPVNAPAGWGMFEKQYSMQADSCYAAPQMLPHNGGRFNEIMDAISIDECEEELFNTGSSKSSFLGHTRAIPKDKHFNTAPRSSCSSSGGILSKLLNSVGIGDESEDYYGGESEEASLPKEEEHGKQKRRNMPPSRLDSEYLKGIALMQNADGSFGEEDIEETIWALLEFAHAECPIKVFSKQIKKALAWLIKNQNEWIGNFDLAMKVYTVIAEIQKRGAMKQEYDDAAKEILERHIYLY